MKDQKKRNPKTGYIQREIKLIKKKKLKTNLIKEDKGPRASPSLISLYAAFVPEPNPPPKPKPNPNLLFNSISIILLGLLLFL